MIVTSDVVVFANIDSPENPTVLDAIPMFQIDEIKLWDSKGEPRSEEEIQGCKQEMQVGPISADDEDKMKKGPSKGIDPIRHEKMWNSARKWYCPSLNASVCP